MPPANAGARAGPASARARVRARPRSRVLERGTRQVRAVQVGPELGVASQHSWASCRRSRGTAIAPARFVRGTSGSHPPLTRGELRTIATLMPCRSSPMIVGIGEVAAVEVRRPAARSIPSNRGTAAAGGCDATRGARAPPSDDQHGQHEVGRACGVGTDDRESAPPVVETACVACIGPPRTVGSPVNGPPRRVVERARMDRCAATPRPPSQRTIGRCWSPETIREAPKALLHGPPHGGLRPATVIDLAAGTGTRTFRPPTSTSSPRPLPARRRPQDPGALPRDLPSHRRGHAVAQHHRPGRGRVRRGPGGRWHRLCRGPVRPELSHGAWPDARRGHARDARGLRCRSDGRGGRPPDL